jgi:hypothetical protein
MLEPKACYELVWVTEARYLGGFRLWLRFSDGAEGEIDLERELWGEVFEPLKDPSYFAKVKLNDDLRTVAWPNGADLSPEFLRTNIQPVGASHADGAAALPASRVR